MTEAPRKTYPSLADEPWEPLLRDGDIEGAIVSFVGCYDYVTFPEILRRFEHTVETKGDEALTLGAPTLVIWMGMSKRMADAFMNVLRDQRVYPHPAGYLTYFIDGGILPLPMAKRVPKGGYKKDHWLAITLRTVPFR